MNMHDCDLLFFNPSKYLSSQGHKVFYTGLVGWFYLLPHTSLEGKQTECGSKERVCSCKSSAELRAANVHPAHALQSSHGETPPSEQSSWHIGMPERSCSANYQTENMVSVVSPWHILNTNLKWLSASVQPLVYQSITRRSTTRWEFCFWCVQGLRFLDFKQSTDWE